MDLLERVKQGDVDAFETLFRQFQGEVYGWIVQIVRDRGTAEDLTIETFWRIYRSRARFDSRYAFSAWARRIATNLAIDHLRARHTEKELEQKPAVEPADPALQREIREKIQQAFHHLSPKLRATARLALIEERSYEEIASAFGEPVATIRTRVFRAARQLQHELERLGIKP